MDFIKMRITIIRISCCPLADSDYYKSQALKNAKEAYQIHQARVSGITLYMSVLMDGWKLLECPSFCSIDQVV